MLIRAAVLTISDRCSRGESTDLSGPAVAEVLRARLGADVVVSACVADVIDDIRAQVLRWLDDDSLQLVVTTGGTGLAMRDVTPEAIRTLLHREAPGLMELARARTTAITPLASLSRGIAGTIGSTLVLTLPGSPKGAIEQLSALLDVLPHAIAMLGGDDLMHARSNP